MEGVIVKGIHTLNAAHVRPLERVSQPLLAPSSLDFSCKTQWRTLLLGNKVVGIGLNGPREGPLPSTIGQKITSE